MLLIITALRKEADPLITHFRLKRNMRGSVFPVFENESVALIVSGVGKLRAAIAASHLLSRSSFADEETLLCNIGFCGARDASLSSGTLVLPHKISDADTGRDYYPDYPLSISDPLPRVVCVCAAHPVQGADHPLFATHMDAQICDMESAGVMEAAGKYLNTHQVLILKIVSDALEPQIDNLSLLERSLFESAPQAIQIMTEAANSMEKESAFSDRRLHKRITPLSLHLRLTTQMQRRLIANLRRALLAGMPPDAFPLPLDFAAPNNKNERKSAFEELMRRLDEYHVPYDLH